MRAWNPTGSAVVGTAEAVLLNDCIACENINGAFDIPLIATAPVPEVQAEAKTLTTEVLEDCGT